MPTDNLTKSIETTEHRSALSYCRKFFGSVGCLTIVLLIVVELFVQVAKPLTRLNATGLTTLNQYYVVSKLPEFLNSSETPDVIMTGSSLFLHPAIRCDDRLRGRRTRYDSHYIRDVIDTYVGCEYLASLIKEKSGKTVSITNLATAGALFSDQYMVFKKCLAKGKKPQVVICDISPRSFLDRNQSEIEKTPVYLVMADYLSLEDLLEAKASLSSILQSLVGSKWTYLRDRSDYREVFRNFACRISNHPGDLFSAHKNEQENLNLEVSKAQQPSVQDGAPQLKSEPLYAPKAFDERDLNYYRKVYLPIDWNMYGKEMEFLRLYLELAHSKHVAVVMVKVPLPHANLALLPEDLTSKYNSDVAALAAKYKATLVDPLTSTQFSRADFEDNAHLNADGGDKLFKAIEPVLNGAIH